MDNIQPDPEVLEEVDTVAVKLHLSPQGFLGIIFGIVILMSVCAVAAVWKFHKRYRANQERWAEQLSSQGSSMVEGLNGMMDLEKYEAGESLPSSPIKQTSTNDETLQEKMSSEISPRIPEVRGDQPSQMNFRDSGPSNSIVFPTIPSVNSTPSSSPSTPAFEMPEQGHSRDLDLKPPRCPSPSYQPR